MTEGTSQSDTNSSDLTEDRRLSHYVDMWKQSVETQQHFNTIEWQIRGLALTVATFALASIFHREALGRCDGLRITVWV